MSIYHKLLIEKWKKQGWSIELQKGKLFARKNKNKILLGLTSKL